jgi:hypothetical protein
MMSDTSIQFIVTIVYGILQLLIGIATLYQQWFTTRRSSKLLTTLEQLILLIWESIGTTIQAHTLHIRERFDEYALRSGGFLEQEKNDGTQVIQTF